MKAKDQPAKPALCSQAQARLLQLPTEAHGLFDAELLALLIGSDRYSRSELGSLLELIGGLHGLIRKSSGELRRLGLSPVITARLIAAVELVRRAMVPAGDPIIVRDPDAAYQLLAPRLTMLDQEHFVVVCLGTRAEVLYTEHVTVGTRSLVLVDTPTLFRVAIRHQAASILVAHNHPSGDPTPSTQDLELTLRLAEAGRVLSIPLLDHLVIAGRGYHSLAVEAGLPGLLTIEPLLAS